VVFGDLSNYYFKFFTGDFLLSFSFDLAKSKKPLCENKEVLVIGSCLGRNNKVT
jgi:hypothetical protein